MEFVLLQAVFLPLLLSPVAYLIGRNYGATYATWFTFGLLLYCSIIQINAALGGTYEEHYPWTTMFGEFGFMLDGLEDDYIVDDDGQRWTKTDRDDVQSTYGDMSYMWEYRS